MVKPLRIVPLGGLGEVGKNCLVLEYDQHLLVIDTGILFPEESVYGVDLAAPDFSYVLDRRDRVRGIVLTRGARGYSSHRTFFSPIHPRMPLHT